MVFSEKVKEITKNLHMLSHPFYQAWMKGELSQEDLKNYAVQYTPFVDHFPRYVSRIHSQCVDATARKALMMNLAEEEGFPGQADHPTLWRGFARGLGVNTETMDQVPATSEARALAQSFQESCDASYAEGLAALYAYEHQIPEVSKSKIKGLADNYGITDAASTEFFAVHETADELHSQSCAQLLDQLSEEEQEKALRAAQKCSQALWNFLSSCYKDQSPCRPN